MTDQLLTLGVVHDTERILLGCKKRGFGQGLWNGFGGKVEPGETLAAAAQREVWEECRLQTTKIERCGYLRFTFGEGILGPLAVHVFRVLVWQGEPVETEEMMPRWFRLTDIPYTAMWPDDVFWLPQVLAGSSIQGNFHFDRQYQLQTWEVQEVARMAQNWHD